MFGQVIEFKMWHPMTRVSMLEMLTESSIFLLISLMGGKKKTPLPRKGIMLHHLIGVPPMLEMLSECFFSPFIPDGSKVTTSSPQKRKNLVSLKAMENIWPGHIFINT